MTKKEHVRTTAFNPEAKLPYELRLKDFELAMQDVYDFFFDVNTFLTEKGLDRLEDMLRPAILSGVISDMVSASLSKHSRVLTQNQYHNGHPDLVVKGRYPANAVKAGKDGVEIKTTRKRGGQVDTHGARDQWMCVCSYTKPTARRSQLSIDPRYDSWRFIWERSPSPISARTPGANLVLGPLRSTQKEFQSSGQAGSTS
jgi:hypothetical protein